MKTAVGRLDEAHKRSVAQFLVEAFLIQDKSCTVLPCKPVISLEGADLEGVYFGGTALETALFRVAQEALANVRKHAEADRVHVALERRAGIVLLEVKDSGRGFNTAGLGQRSGPGERVGLSSMSERIVLLGGGLEIRSEPGAGTSVVAEVPLPAVMEAQDGYGRG